MTRPRWSTFRAIGLPVLIALVYAAETIEGVAMKKVENDTESRLEIVCIERPNDYCQGKRDELIFNDGCRLCQCRKGEAFCKSADCTVSLAPNTDPEKYCEDIFKKNERVENGIVTPTSATWNDELPDSTRISALITYAKNATNNATNGDLTPKPQMQSIQSVGMQHLENAHQEQGPRFPSPPPMIQPPFSFRGMNGLHVMMPPRFHGADDNFPNHPMDGPKIFEDERERMMHPRIADPFMWNRERDYDRHGSQEPPKPFHPNERPHGEFHHGLELNGHRNSLTEAGVVKNDPAEREENLGRLGKNSTIAGDTTTDTHIPGKNQSKTRSSPKKISRDLEGNSKGEKLNANDFRSGNEPDHPTPKGRFANFIRNIFGGKRTRDAPEKTKRDVPQKIIQNKKTPMNDEAMHGQQWVPPSSPQHGPVEDHQLKFEEAIHKPDFHFEGLRKWLNLFKKPEFQVHKDDWMPEVHAEFPRHKPDFLRNEMWKPREEIQKTPKAPWLFHEGPYEEHKGSMHAPSDLIYTRPPHWDVDKLDRKRWENHEAFGGMRYPEPKWTEHGPRDYGVRYPPRAEWIWPHRPHYNEFPMEKSPIMPGRPWDPHSPESMHPNFHVLPNGPIKAMADKDTTADVDEDRTEHTIQTSTLTNDTVDLNNAMLPITGQPIASSKGRSTRTKVSAASANINDPSSYEQLSYPDMNGNERMQYLLDTLAHVKQQLDTTRAQLQNCEKYRKQLREVLMSRMDQVKYWSNAGSTIFNSVLPLIAGVFWLL